MIKQFEVNDILNENVKEITYKIQLKDIEKITGFSDNVTNNEFIYRDFKYSSDDYTYSYWEEFSIEKLKNLKFDHRFFLRIRYTLTDFLEEAKINSLSIEYDESPNFKEGDCFMQSNKARSMIEVNTPSFDVYQNSDIGIDLHRKLSYTANEMFGINAIYYKSDILETDTFLHEHILLELADKCGVQLKVLFDSNETPATPMITPFGTTFEFPIDVFLDKTYFEMHFKNHVPSNGDIIFIPTTKAIWEVNGSDIVSGYGNNPLYWKVTLNKYQPKAMRFEDNLKYDSILDNLKESGYNIMTAEDAFSAGWNEEQEKVIKPRETRSNDNSKDPLNIHKDVKVKKEDIENSFITISYFNYNISDVPINDSALTYSLPTEVNEEFSFTAWIKLNPTKAMTLIKIENKKLFTSRTDIPKNLYVNNKATNQVYFITVENKEVFENIPDGFYYILSDAQNIFNDWFVLNNRFILNNRLKIAQEIVPLKENVWYNIIITESVRFNQVAFYIYGLNQHSNDLDLFTSKHYDLRSNFNFDTLRINGGLKAITNIRLFDEMLQEEHHHIVMNQQLVNDSQKALVIDNVKPEFIQEYYGKPI